MAHLVKRVRLHQRLGYAGVVLAALVIVVGFVTALRAAKYGSASTTPGVLPLAFLIVPLFDLLMFAILFGAAVYYRRRPATHKRLMLLTVINFLPPAHGSPSPPCSRLAPSGSSGCPLLSRWCA
jgi:hypothetical protein